MSNELTDQVLGSLRDLAKRRGIECEITPATEDFRELGLDSFAFAELVLILEQRTGRDPFTTAEEVVPVHSVADLIRIYAEAAPQAG